MGPELHLHPDRLHAHAVTAAGLAEDLRAAVPVPTGTDGPEQQRIRAAVRRAVTELSEAAGVLAGVAAAAQAADRAAERAVRGAGGGP